MNLNIKNVNLRRLPKVTDRIIRMSDEQQEAWLANLNLGKIKRDIMIMRLKKANARGVKKVKSFSLKDSGGTSRAIFAKMPLAELTIWKKAIEEAYPRALRQDADSKLVKLQKIKAETEMEIAKLKALVG